MFRPNWKYLVFAGVLVGTLTMGVSQADAQWGWYHTAYWSCSPCGYASWCAPSCGGWYLGWRPGPVRRLLFGRYRWYYDGWGGCWDPCCWDVCCSNAVPVCAPVTPAPGAGQTPTPAPSKPAPELPPEEPKPTLPQTPAPQTLLPTQSNSGLLTILVPAEAKVLINGLETRSTGSRRQYVSYGLKPGYTYKYEIRAQTARDGKLVEDTRTVFLTAGARQNVVFNFGSTRAEQLATAR